MIGPQFIGRRHVFRAALAALSLGVIVGAAPPDAPATFSRDIAPILYSQCAACHRPGGSAPFSLLTYTDARQHANQIAAATRSRFMPPWKPDAGSGPFVGERRLTDAQILLLERWSATGTTPGNAANLPPLPRETDGWPLGTPDLVVTLPEYTLRPDGTDVFRNFVVTAPGAGTRYVRGLTFRPGNRAVHHANIRVDPTPASKRLDEADPAPGYEGTILRSADYPDGHFLGWTPGQAPPLAPPGLAWRLNAGDDFVVQLHLRPTGKSERLQPAIGLYFTSDPPARTPTILRLGRQGLNIAPGVRDYRVTDSYVLPVDAEVHAIQPHAHYRARSVEAWATLPDGSRRSLVQIRDWDFNWQDQYRYASPFWLPAGTRLDMAFLFDNSDDNPRNPDRPAARVSWGWRTADEMGDVWIQVMTRTDADRARLSSDIRRKMATEDTIGCETLIAREPEYADLRNDAALLYMELGQPARALLHFQAVSRLAPVSPAAHYNVAVALEAMGRTGDAAAEYEAALRLDPAYSLAHNNLGSLRFAEGRMDEARRHYEAAVASGPDNAEAHNNLCAVSLATGDASAAIAECERAARLRSTYPEAHFNLARAYASAGRFDDAIRAATTADAQAVAAGKTALSAQIREQLRLYRGR
jgi:tetratricopeptide (TPR) repeat protein/mono/diheme cytochrome c family protein